MLQDNTFEAKQQNMHKQAVLKFVKEHVEDVYNVCVVFCAETGSRGYGTHCKISDLDVKGFFVKKEKDYLNVREGLKLLQKTSSHLTLEDGSKIEFDYVFLDFRKFLKRKTQAEKIDQFNLWSLSQSIYINKLDDISMDFLKTQLKLPFFALNGHLKSFQKELLKIQKVGESKALIKEMLNCIVVGSMLLHMILFNRSPHYNTWSQQATLEEYRVEEQAKGSSIPQSLTELPEISKLAKTFYERKIYDKGSTEFVCPELLKWIDGLLALYQTYRVDTLPPQYNETPEISPEQADTLFYRVMRLVQEKEK